ncbi:MAG: HAD-IA family hydrolase [Lachnospiraceae bacterium]|nr:HAD-IA family hydrolase [Lachnospiraceae bacterium]
MQTKCDKNGRAYIWDLDGTLLDSYGIITESLYETYLECGVEAEREELHRIAIIDSVTRALEELSAKTGISVLELKERYSLISERRKPDMRTIPGAKELLTFLAQSGAVHYVYTHRGASTESVLSALSLTPFFKEVVTAKSGFARKPAPDALLYLIDKHQLDPENTYYVGDRTIDMDCAKNAGIKRILFAPPDSYCIPNGSEQYLVEKLSEIAEI